MTTIAIVGAGFVADYYVTTLANHPEDCGLAAYGIMIPSGSSSLPISTDFVPIARLNSAWKTRIVPSWSI
jgi:hypothetical protein